MHRFFVGKNISGTEFVIDEAGQANQILKVLRLSEGDRILVFDGSGPEYLAEISGRTGKEVFLNIIEKRDGIGFPREVTLYQSILKKDNFELIVQKATELGVSKIVPVISNRCVKREFSESGMDRLRHVMTEATEQSRGAVLPELTEPMTFDQAISSIDKQGISILAYEGDVQRQISDINLSHQKISIFIGPEGGFTEGEYRLAEQYGIIAITLGKRILRAETAAIAALARILL